MRKRKESAESRRRRLDAAQRLHDACEFRYSIGGNANCRVFEVGRDGSSRPIAMARSSTDADKIAHALNVAEIAKVLSRA